VWDGGGGGGGHDLANDHPSDLKGTRQQCVSVVVVVGSGKYYGMIW